MGQTLVKNYLHVIFSTKNREPFIQPEIEVELHKVICGICSRLECTPIRIGGYTDHIHLLCMLSTNIALSTLVGEAKSHSSKWIKFKGAKWKNFSWQSGYGAFSVKPNDVERLITYISNQHEHHQKQNFKEEYENFLKSYEMEFNEKYLWS